MVIVISGLVTNRGVILNQSTSELKKFFNFKNDSDFSQIKNIKQLMPKMISKIHDQIIVDYIKQGYLKNQGSQNVLYLDAQGCYCQGKINIGN